MAEQTGPQSDPSAFPSMPYRVAALGSRKPTRFRFVPQACDRATLAAALRLLDLPRLDFSGEIIPVGRHDYRLTARLSASVVQACVVTLAPVPANLTEEITRSYVRDYHAPDVEEVELSQDDDAEPLPEIIDIVQIAVEALALALPLYPRARNAKLGVTEFAPPGAEPIRESDLKPFAGLAGLAERLKGNNESQE